MKPQKVEISYKTIIFTVLFLIGLFLLWRIRNILLLIFICFIFMQVFNPIVTRFERLKIPRFVSIIFLYLLIIGTIYFTFAGIIPALIEQTTALINTLPNIVKNIKIFGASAIDFSSQFKILENVPGNIAKTAMLIVSNVFSVLLIFLVSFYLLLERKNFGKYGLNIFGEKGKDKFLKIIKILETRLGRWVNAEIILMTIIGVLSYIGYLFLGLKYAVPLAILAGLLEAIPTLGPIISTSIASLIALTISPFTAFLTLILGIVIQQLENNFIVPKVMKETVGFNPLVTILLIVSGARLGGVIGAVLALPVAITIEVIFKTLTER